MSVAAIVPAAGAGRRFGGRTPKLAMHVGGAPLLIQTLRALQQVPDIRWIVPVVPAGRELETANLLAANGITKAVAPCAGGASRAESVARGFQAAPASAKWILVHDGARPCVSRRLVEACLRQAKRSGAAVAGLPASVTVKAVGRGRRVLRTLEREELWFIQTPQVFRRDWFGKALQMRRKAWATFPDDAAIVEAAGYRVTVVPGDPLNIKVTTRADVVLAEAILSTGVEAAAFAA